MAEYATDAKRYLFTPRSHDGSERYQWQISEQDMRKAKRGRRWGAFITNLTDGRRYKVRGASCGLRGCFCDAEVVQEDKGEGRYNP